VCPAPRPASGGFLECVRILDRHAPVAQLYGSCARRAWIGDMGRRQLADRRWIRWLTGSYDPALNLVYWGTGNPGPTGTAMRVPGRQLYTCSLVASIDGRQDQVALQFTPHDVHRLGFQ